MTTTPILLDVDTGIDDTMALLYAALHSEIELVAAGAVRQPQLTLGATGPERRRPAAECRKRPNRVGGHETGTVSPLRERPADGLGLQVLLEAFEAVLPTHAARLVAAER